MDNKDFFDSKREVVLSGKTFMVSDITLGDLADFEVYCDNYKKKRLVETYKLCEQKPDVSKIIDTVATEVEREQMMSQIHGMIYLLHKILSKHQEIDIKEVKNKISVPDLKIIMKVISDGMIDPDNNTDSEAEKNVVIM